MADAVVLSEDQGLQNLAYRWLVARGVDSHRIRRLPLPAGRGAGDAYVLEQYPKEVADQRARARRVTRSLVVAIDADRYRVASRLAGLDRALEEAGMEPRGAGERICVLVPRRNCETWIHFLACHAVDEDSDYKPIYADDLAKACAEAGARLHDWLRGRLQKDGVPDSLERFRAEAARIPAPP